MMIRCLFCFGLLFCSSAATDYYVLISDNGPIVSGASITFKAELFTVSSEPPSGTFSFRWFDNAIPQNSAEFTGKSTQSTWVAHYPKRYVPGQYEVEVDVYKEFIFMIPICSHRKFFNITRYMTGSMELMQNNSTIENTYVSNAVAVKHEIKLHQPDYDYLKQNASSVLTYWFVDCVYYGSTTDFTFYFNYTDIDVKHRVEAIIVASHEPLPPPTTTTVTPTTINTTTTPAVPVTTDHNTTTIHLVSLPEQSATESDASKSESNEITDLLNHKELLYATSENKSSGSAHKMNERPNLPFVCMNSTVVPDPSKTYGYFSRKVKGKAPVTDVKAEGNVWLQHGDLLILQVTCNGTGPFSYCVKFWNGIHNVTGNETCMFDYSMPTCSFPVHRYLSDSITYTMVLIIRNDVSKTVIPIGINVYEVMKHAQLSVIIVPISAIIVVVVFIIFGVAYHIQSKRRYTVEVADFDFSHLNDMEYKTFRERLLESISNAFNKEEEYSEQDSNSPAPSTRKYGSMR